MEEIPLSLLKQIILFLSTPLVFGYLAIRLKLPVIVGYIIAGVVLSISISVGLTDVISFFANFGLIILLFTLGLEIDLSLFRKHRVFVIAGGALQVVLTALCAFTLSILFGFGVLSSLILGAGFALSSTAIVSKLLQEKGEEQSLFGQLAIGILIFQDIVVVPLIIIFSSYQVSAHIMTTVFSILVGLIKSGLIIGVIYLFGEVIVPYIFGKMGKISRELLNLFTILFIFIVVFFFSFVGLSPFLVAFVTGILVGQTMSQYHIFSQIRPLRNIFIILFFVFLGASTQIGSYINLIPAMFLFAVILVAIKVLLIILIFTYYRFHSKTSFSVGVLLSQVGELAFVLFYISRGSSLIDDQTYVFSVGVTLFALILSSLLINKREVMFISIRKYIKKHISSLERFIVYAVDRGSAHIDALSMNNHVIICGYGLVGRYVGRALTLARVPFVVVDYNYHTVKRARDCGVECIYGDPTEINILDYAQIKHASCVVIAIPQEYTQEMIILNAKTLNSNVAIFTRVKHEINRKRLRDLGAKVVIQPEFEVAVSIVRKILTSYHVEKEDIIGKITRLKIEHGMN